MNERPFLVLPVSLPPSVQTQDSSCARVSASTFDSPTMPMLWSAAVCARVPKLLEKPVACEPGRVYAGEFGSPLMML